MEDSVQSIGRAFDVLRLVATAGELGLRLSDVAERTGLHKASASRILRTLVAQGVLQRHADRRFRVHETFRELIGIPISSTRLREMARPVLSSLVERLGEVAFLSVRSGFESLCVDRQVGWQVIQALSLHVGARRPLGVGAGSMALLAWLPPSEQEQALAFTTARLAPYPLLNEPQLRSFVGAAQNNGYTDLRDVVIAGMTGMGIPLRDPTGNVIGALSIAGPSNRFTDENSALAVEALRESQSLIEASIASGVEGGAIGLPTTAGGHATRAIPENNMRRKTWVS
jgi:DNA-binding IclR family transcriptional regulator